MLMYTDLLLRQMSRRSQNAVFPLTLRMLWREDLVGSGEALHNGWRVGVPGTWFSSPALVLKVLQQKLL